MKGFCEDVLGILDKLKAGECSMKGFVCLKLFKIQQKLKGFTNSSGDYLVNIYFFIFSAILKFLLF